MLRPPGVNSTWDNQKRLLTASPSYAEDEDRLDFLGFEKKRF